MKKIFSIAAAMAIAIFSVNIDLAAQSTRSGGNVGRNESVRNGGNTNAPGKNDAGKKPADYGDKKTPDSYKGNGGTSHYTPANRGHKGGPAVNGGGKGVGVGPKHPVKPTPQPVRVVPTPQRVVHVEPAPAPVVHVAPGPHHRNVTPPPPAPPSVRAHPAPAPPPPPPAPGPAVVDFNIGRVHISVPVL